MKLPLAAGCLTVVFALGGCATAPQSKSVTVEELFQKADQSGDGSVSRAEYEDFMVAQLFAIYDRNGDGFITEEEYVADGGTAADFKKLNVSGTGKLTKAEAMKSQFIRNRLAAPFDEADADHTGSVTWEEFQVALAERRAYTR